jgi:hypothetical protein
MVTLIRRNPFGVIMALSIIICGDKNAHKITCPSGDRTRDIILCLALYLKAGETDKNLWYCSEKRGHFSLVMIWKSGKTNREQQKMFFY